MTAVQWASIRVLIVFGLALATAPALAACSSAPTAPADQHEITTRDLPPYLTARGVVLAAVLLSDGDIESALINGLVTPAEVDEAVLAIENGELEHWVSRAEAELDH